MGSENEGAIKRRKGKTYEQKTFASVSMFLPEKSPGSQRVPWKYRLLSFGT